MHRAKLNSQPDILSVAGKQQLWQHFYDKTNITMDETENEFSSSDVIGVFLLNFLFGPNHLFSILNLVHCPLFPLPTFFGNVGHCFMGNILWGAVVKSVKMQDTAGLTLPINTCVSVIDLQIVFQVFFRADLCVCVIVCTRPFFVGFSTYIFIYRPRH